MLYQRFMKFNIQVPIFVIINSFLDLYIIHKEAQHSLNNQDQKELIIKIYLQNTLL